MKYASLGAAVVAVALLGLAAPSAVAAPQMAGDAALVPWTFREDFHHGIPAWMSYPLAQDVGYDPTLYTKEITGVPCLVRDVTAYGQRVLHVGIIKPLRFHADRSSSFKLTYELEMGGRLARVRFLLAGKDGRLYPLPLPDTPGTHTVDVQGKSLGLSKDGTDVEAVAIESDVQSPDLGSSNRLILRQFQIDAERPAELVLSAPKLVRSANDGPWLDSQVLDQGKPLVVKAKASVPVKISVYDGAGDSVPIESAPLENAKTSAAIRVIFRHKEPPGLWRAVIGDGHAHTEFQFLVLGPNPPHPRVLLTPERLEQLRAPSGSTPVLDAIRAKAKSLRSSLAYNPDAGSNIALLPAGSVFPGLPEYVALMEDYGNVIAFNGVEYALTGDPRALNAARRALLTVAGWPTWTPTWFTAHGLHTYYLVGVFSQRVAIGYDLVADQLTPAEKSTITEAAFRNAIEPTVEEYFLMNRLPNAASNHMANSVGGSIALVAALYGDAPEWDGRLATALAELSVAYNHLLKGLFPGDGSEAEPAGYEAFTMEGMSLGQAALDALGIHPRGIWEMEQCFWWPRYAEVTPDLVLDTGDFGGMLRGLPGFAWGAEHAGDPSLRAFYDTAEMGTLLGVSKVLHTGRSLEMAPGILDLACCSKPATPTPVPPPSRIFPGRGSAVLRSGWKPADTVISIRVGPWFNHEHHDQGSFQVVAFGEKLIDEAGYADYYKDPNYQSYFTQAAGHNTVLVDDDPFSQPGENGCYWKALAHYPSFTAHILSPQADYLSAQLSDAYDGVLKHFQREFIFLKPDILIVRDRLEAATAHRYTWLLHVPMGARMRIEHANAFITGQKAGAALSAVGPNSHWTIQATPLPGILYGDLDRIELHQPYEFKLESAEGTSASFLVGMHVARGGPVPLQPISAENSEGLESLDAQNPWTTVFRTGAGPLTIGSFSTDGQILVAKRGTPVTIIFAAEARSLSDDDKMIFEAASPVTASLEQSPRATEVHFFCARTSGLRIRVEKRPTEVELDGKRIQPQVSNDFLDLRSLPEGEHFVRIRD